MSDEYLRDRHRMQVDAALNQVDVVTAMMDNLDQAITTLSALTTRVAFGEEGHQAQTAVGRMARESNGMRAQARAARQNLNRLREML